MLKKILILAAALVLLSGETALAADATAARLSVSYSTKGELRITNTYNGPIHSSCFLRFRGTIYYEGNHRAQSIMNLSSRRRVTTKSLRLTIRNLPGVLTRHGHDPILTIQSKTYCSDRVFVSNPVARFVVCGSGGRYTTPRDFLQKLSIKLTSALWST
jgi:hypothetical protein